MASSPNTLSSNTQGQALDQRPSCPNCRSFDTSSAAKQPTASSYWRCLRCGDVFSPALLSDASRRNFSR
jgi:transposase-like protein